MDVLVALIDRQGDEAAVRELRADRFHGSDPVQHRQAQVDEGDVGTQLPEQVHRLSPVSGLSDDRHVALRGHHGDDPSPHERVVVCDQDPDWDPLRHGQGRILAGARGFIIPGGCALLRT